MGEALGRALRAGDALGLVGDLGAGKTHFVQALAAGLGVPADVRVTSPTFTLVNLYRGGRTLLAHADLYRLEREAELVELGLDELIGGDAAVVIEWADRFRLLAPDSLVIELTVTSETSRALTPVTQGAEGADLLARWRRELDQR